MHPNTEHVQSAILACGVGCQVVELPDSTRSAADAAEAIGCTLGQIVKSLLFLAGADAVLVLTSGTALAQIPRPISPNTVEGGTPDKPWIPHRPPRTSGGN